MRAFVRPTFAQEGARRMGHHTVVCPAAGETQEAKSEGRRSGRNMRLEAMAVTMPRVAGHPNRIPFEGVLTVVDAASDRAPSGARGHRVILTRTAAMAALPSLLGMAVDYRPGWDGHDARRKCGILTQADIEGKGEGAKLSVS